MWFFCLNVSESQRVFMFEGVMHVSNRQSRSNTCPQLLIPSNQLEWVVSGVWPRNAVDMFLGHQFVSDIPKKITLYLAS